MSPFRAEYPQRVSKAAQNAPRRASRSLWHDFPRRPKSSQCVESTAESDDFAPAKLAQSATEVQQVAEGLPSRFLPRIADSPRCPSRTTYLPRYCPPGAAALAQTGYRLRLAQKPSLAQKPHFLRAQNPGEMLAQKCVCLASKRTDFEQGFSNQQCRVIWAILLESDWLRTPREQFVYTRPQVEPIMGVP